MDIYETTTNKINTLHGKAMHLKDIGISGDFIDKALNTRVNPVLTHVIP
jgi:hypothetical protein